MPSSQSSGEAAYSALLTSIREGVFDPETGCARKLSANSFRSLGRLCAALRRLEADGIVEHRARIGAVIRRLSHSEVVELYEMRVVLERTAAELAAKHGTDAEFDALDERNDDIARERTNPAKAAAINQEFHQGLYLACRNRFLLEAARALNNSLLLLGPTTYTDEARIDVVFSQHKNIVDALRNGDSEAAGAAAKLISKHHCAIG